MLINLEGLQSAYNMRVRGVLHVGAHEGQEYDEYRRLFGQEIPITWIEADPVVFERLQGTLTSDPKSTCINAVVSDRDLAEATFNRANNEQSSSILPLGTHKQAHPEVSYEGSFEVKTTTVDSLARTNDFGDLNFLNMDVQGAEGMVVKGARRYLASVDYIYSEVNRDELYVGCMTLTDFDKLLKEEGFTRVELMMLDGFGWGDAFYVRTQK